MKATETPLFAFMQKSAQFIIPIYQRTYSWTTKECEQLWKDVLRIGQNDDIDGHFIGSVVYVERGIYSHSAIPQLLVIDGQQRLATVSLIIAALSRALRDKPPIEGVTARKLTNYYLLNAEEDGDLYYKLLLTKSDREILQKIVCDKPPKNDDSNRLLQNFRFYKDKIKDDDDLLKIVYRGLSKLIIVDIALDRDHDNPQLIFESLNSTGMDLSQADLIRNYVLMGLEPKVQHKLYEDYWFPLEQVFNQGGHTKLFDRFMRDYLTIKTDAIPRISEVYEAFKNYNGSSNMSIEEIVADVHRYGKYYIAFAREREQDKELRMAFQNINALKVDVAYPFLLELYHDYSEGVLERNELLECVRFVESYVFRRAVCEIPTNSLNKTFARLGQELKKDRYLESVKAALLIKTTARRFPDDAEFRSALLSRDMYNMRGSNYRNYWLRRLENYGRKERVNVEEYTIEHIMPQNKNLSAEWQDALGDNWQEVQKNYLHNLGNLTLTGYNPELSDKPFLEKRDMEGGFADSPLRLNNGLGHAECWDREAILSRAKELSARAIEVWPSPFLPNEVLAQYHPEVEKTNYTLADHPKLERGPIREMFKHFRNQVLSLDSSVVEVIRRHYIAYKLDTNFVDVKPQTSRLQLYLNMRFDEIQDPKGVCRDVSGIGTMGNGDVEVGLNTLEELPYVMELVQQAYEKQLEGER